MHHHPFFGVTAKTDLILLFTDFPAVLLFVGVLFDLFRFGVKFCSFESAFYERSFRSPDVLDEWLGAIFFM